MAKGGKYLKKKVPVGKKKSKVGIVLLIILLILLLLIGAAALYINYMLGLISRPEDFTPPSSAAAESVPMATQSATEAMTLPEETTAGTTSPEETWPEVVSDEKITSFMVVGQAARAEETSFIADTMILVSINRETKTLTLTSLMRDMRLVWPHYVDTLGKPHSGNWRINMAYNMGYSWTGNKQDSMDVLESIVQHNFGVPVDRTVEVDFAVFEKVVDALGGVEVEIDEAEAEYFNTRFKDFDVFTHDLTVGTNRLNGWYALQYARTREVGYGDYERTERQREIIMSILNELKSKNILEIHKLFTEILPMITTDMTNAEITNYAFEFIPMLKDLKIQSQRIPFPGNERSIPVRDDNGNVIDNQIAPSNLYSTAKQLQESIGLIEPTEAAN